jgi:hypothetical protein
MFGIIASDFFDIVQQFGSGTESGTFGGKNGREAQSGNAVA